jgi:hypothetical protein
VPRQLTSDQALAMRLAAQRLSGERAAGVAEVVGAVGALQAQDTRASRLGVRARSHGLDVDAVRRACGPADRSVVRTWAMRGTLHMVPAADTAWLVGLLGPRFAAGNARRRAQLGLDEATCERALALLPELLAGGPLTRAELVDALAGRGVAIDRKGQAPAHLVALAAQRGVLCRGPEREADDEPTYVPLATWVPATGPLDEGEALAELARRHLAGHAPAGPADLAAWSGLPVGTARRALASIQDELEPVELAGQPAFVPAGRAPAPALDPTEARLLPAFDAWLLGWRDRSAVLPERFARRVQAGGGWLHPVVLAGGRVVGTWRQRRTGGAGAPRVEIALEPFERLDPALGPSLAAEAADIGRFLGVEAELAG